MWVLCLLLGLLVAMNVYSDDHALDTSLIPRLRGLCLTLSAAVVLLVLPVTARRLDLSVLRDPLVVCYALFSAICFGTLLFALNPTAGFTDAFKTFGALVFLCLLCLLLPTIPRWRERLLQILLCGALLSTGWGYYEMMKYLGWGLHSRGEMAAVRGTMSNENLYAGFLAIAFPLCLVGAIVLRKWWRLLAGATALLTALMVVLVQTRAAYLGLAASLGAAAVLAIVFAARLGIGRRTRLALVWALVAAPLALAAFYFLAPEANPLAVRLRLTAEGTGDASFGGRVMAWAITLQMIADHFPLGVGTGNFTMRLDEYFNAQTDFHGVGANWIYPHNDILWVLVEEGLAGLLAFAGLFLIALWHCFTVLRRSGSKEDAWLAVAVIMVLLAYLMDSAFGFPLARVSHQLYLATAFALAVLLAREGSREKAAVLPAKSYPFRLLAGAVPALVVLMLGFTYSRVAIKQEFYLSAVFALEAEKMWPAALRVLRAAASPWKTTDVFANPWAYHEARVLKQIGTTEEVLEALERAYAQNPNRIHVINDLGTHYARVGRFADAIALLTETVKRYPHQIGCIENLAQCYIDQDDYASALRIFEKIPEDKRTEAIRTKIAACREILEANEPTGQAVTP